MRIVEEAQLITRGPFSVSEEWIRIRAAIRKAVEGVEHPPGTGTFTIHPESGKKRTQGNGVGPIRLGMMAALRQQGWRLEGPAKNMLGQRLGEFDAVLPTSAHPVVLEWETGNISSSHRSINKMTMLLSQGVISAGVLVVPTRRLAKYLTDRIGNFEELEAYWDFWEKYPCDNGVLKVMGIEQDAESTGVPRIPKATDGRARS